MLKKVSIVILMVIGCNVVMVTSAMLHDQNNLEFTENMGLDQRFIEHTTILIKNNTDFSHQGFSGSGTAEDPFTIENLRIENASSSLLEIRDTTAYFLVENNHLDGLDAAILGLSMVNVTHGIIRNNTIRNTLRTGIHLENSQNIIIEYNILANHQAEGIFLSNSGSNVIINNTLQANENGIHLKGDLAKDNLIQYNDFINNKDFSATDNGINNSFINNYWSDQANHSDANKDGFVDSVYQILDINNNAVNTDVFPLVMPGNPQVPSPNPDLELINGIDQFITQLMLVGMLSLTLVILGFVFVRFKSKTRSNSFQAVHDIFESNQSSFLRAIYHKVIIGLENSKTNLISDSMTLPALPEIAHTEHLVIGNIFPPDIREEMKSDIRGRTVLVLIEIAYQDAMKSYAGYISEALEIPQQTLSDDIRKLQRLDYIKTVISPKMLLDGRFKYFILTAKGYLFLHLLKESLAMAIMKVKEET